MKDVDKVASEVNRGRKTSPAHTFKDASPENNAKDKKAAHSPCAPHVDRLFSSRKRQSRLVPAGLSGLGQV